MADAYQAVEDAKAASIDAFSGTAAAKLVGVEDPDEVVKRIGTMLRAPDATANLRSLAKAAPTILRFLRGSSGP